MEKHVVELKNKMVVLTLDPLDLELNVDELTKIQYDNIMGEVLTAPVMLNRIGILLAEVDEFVATTTLDFDIFVASQNEEIRKTITGTGRGGKPTVEEAKSILMAKPEYRKKRMDIISAQKQRDYINSLYWSMKDKSSKLDKLTDKLKPEEFEGEIVEGTVNGIMIKLRKKAIK